MKTIQNSDVTVVIPTLNEERTIAEIIREIKHLGYQNIVIIDGNSEDGTVEIAKDLGVEVVIQNGRGKGTALRQVFNHSGLNGHAIVMMDADGSMSPKEIPMLVESLNSNAHLSKGARFLSYGYSEDMNLVRRMGNLLFVFLVNRFWSANYKDLCYGFAAFRKSALDRLHPHLKSQSFEIETEIFIKAKKLGLKVVEVPSIELRRKFGKSNLKAFRDGFRILQTIFSEILSRE